MKGIVNPDKIPHEVLDIICTVIGNLKTSSPVDALIAYSHHFCDHSYSDLSDLIYTERSKYGPKLISKEGIEWRIAKVRRAIKKEYIKTYGNGCISTVE